MHVLMTKRMRMRALMVMAAAAASMSISSCAREHAPPIAERVAPAAVTVIAADRSNGRLIPVAAGSGVVVDENGAVLTSYHVLHDEPSNRLHDAFIIGRSSASARASVHVCTGRPALGTLDRALDLAVVRCDRDMHQQPLGSSDWSPIALGSSDGVAPGDALWLMGYPRQGDGTLAIVPGHAGGWSGKNGEPGSDYLTVHAEVAPGMSGGGAVNRSGALIGVVSGFRVRTRISAVGTFPVGRIALVRPIEHAIPLLQKANIALSDRSLDR